MMGGLPMNNLEQGASANSGIEQTPYSVIQHNVDNINLTATEIGQLWGTYMAQSMSKCMLPYFIEKCKDPDIRSVLQYTLDVSTQHINSMTELFNKANFPIPHGFTDEDFDINAKPLFSDSYMLIYTRFIAKYGLSNSQLAFTVSTRPDICGFFEGCLMNFIEIHKKANEVLLAKGLLERAPNIPIPDRVEYVHDVQSFYKGLIGQKRPLNALEIGHIAQIIISRSIQNALILGFGQVVKSQKIKDYLSRGKKITDKQMKVLSSLFTDEDLPIPITYQSQVTDSTESPFTDKLILFHLSVFIAHSVTELGYATANCARLDLVVTCARLVAELTDYVKDGLDLSIENGWLERIPESAERKELRNQTH